MFFGAFGIALESEKNNNESSYSTGDSLLLLMGLHRECRVLVVGEILEKWGSVFRNTFTCPHMFTRQFDPHSFELILYHSSVAISSKDFSAEIKQSRSLLSDHGTFLLFAENFRSFSNLKLLWKRQFSSLTGKLFFSLSAYEKVLKNAGYRTVRHFLPMPGLNNLEELVAAGCKALELPHYVHPLIRLISNMGISRYFVDGYVLFGGAERFEASDFFRQINETLSNQTDIRQPECVLGRLDIRLRGALVLFVSEKNSMIHYIVRVVSDPSIDAIVSKNHLFLETLHADIGDATTLLHLLPKPLCRMEYSGTPVYLETMVDGVPAWKVNSHALKERIFRDSIYFLMQLSRFTEKPVLLQRERLLELFNDDRNRLKDVPSIDTGFRERIIQLLNTLVDCLTDREICLNASHGDYGYGNILVDPSSGELRGVIDWDTGRRHDLPGIDFINLLVQKERTERNCGVLDAFSIVVNRGLSEANLGILKELGVAGQLVAAIVYLAFVRYVSRSAQYPQVFIREQSDYIGILDLMQSRMPL